MSVGSTVKKKISLLVVDDNDDFREIMKLYISKIDDIEIVGTACDGLEAVDKIVDLLPDFVTLDLIMPNLDGIGVLEKIRDMHLVKKPIIIIMSALSQDMLIKKALSMGIEYYLVKPLDIANLVKRIRQIYQYYNNVSGVSEVYFRGERTQNIASMPEQYNSGYSELDLEVTVTNLLNEAGVAPHLRGHRYLKEAIIYTININRPLKSITKELYPAIAKQFQTTSQKVERAIRNCIEKAFLRTNDDNIDSLLGYSSNSSKSKPTNWEFIAMIAERVRLNQRNTY